MSPSWHDWNKIGTQITAEALMSGNVVASGTYTPPPSPIRIIFMEVCGDSFGLEYHRRDWSKAVAAACRWKDQGLIDEIILRDMAVLVLQQAAIDGELVKPPVRPSLWQRVLESVFGLLKCLTGDRS